MSKLHKDDAEIARQLVLKDARRSARMLRDLGIQSRALTFTDPMPVLEDSGEGALVNLVIGERGKLTVAEARAAGDKFREIVHRYPNALVYLCLLGYDDDPREIPQIVAAARYVRRFAKFAGIDDFEAALLGPIGEMGAALLGACGAFGEEMKRRIEVPSVPTAQ
jgi:hypothetical protein